MSESNPPYDPNSADFQEFSALMKEKMLAVIGHLSLGVERMAGADIGEVRHLVHTYAPDFLDDTHWGKLAVQATYDGLILDLLQQLAAARGESITVAWQRVAADATRAANEA